jgi:hypothetical protein
MFAPDFNGKESDIFGSAEKPRFGKKRKSNFISVNKYSKNSALKNNILSQNFIPNDTDSDSDVDQQAKFLDSPSQNIGYDDRLHNADLRPKKVASMQMKKSDSMNEQENERLIFEESLRQKPDKSYKEGTKCE